MNDESTAKSTRVLASQKRPANKFAAGEPSAECPPARTRHNLSAVRAGGQSARSALLPRIYSLGLRRNIFPLIRNLQSL